MELGYCGDEVGMCIYDVVLNYWRRQQQHQRRKHNNWIIDFYIRVIISQAALYINVTLFPVFFKKSECVLCYVWQSWFLTWKLGVAIVRTPVTKYIYIWLAWGRSGNNSRQSAAGREYLKVSYSDKKFNMIKLVWQMMDKIRKNYGVDIILLTLTVTEQ